MREMQESAQIMKSKGQAYGNTAACWEHQTCSRNTYYSGERVGKCSPASAVKK